MDPIASASSAPLPRPGTVGRRTWQGDPADVLTAVAAIAVVAIAVAAILSPDPSARALGARGALAAAAASFAGGTWLVSNRRRAEPETRWLGGSAGAAAALLVGTWAVDRLGGRTSGMASLGPWVIVAALLGAAAIRSRRYVSNGAGPFLSDVGVTLTAVGVGIVAVLLGAATGPGSAVIVATGGTLAALLVAVSLVGAIWEPSGPRAAAVGAEAMVALAVVVRAHVAASGPTLTAWPDALAAVGLIALLVLHVLRLDPRSDVAAANLTTAPPAPRSLITPALAAAAILFVMTDPAATGTSERGAVVLVALVSAALASRSALAQAALLRSVRVLQSTVDDREDALARARRVSSVAAASEARHRLLIDAAADGVVELDAAGRITRANRAFCSMCRVAPSDVVGLSWAELARRVDRGGSMAALAEIGHAVLTTASGTVHLEASASPIPGSAPGTLLVIRDITARRVAERTARTLLKCLQDRDEDRSRLLRRSSAAIEAERNRIARDLHDGPIQGVSAAALSLEAVRLMLTSGDRARATETLETICKELSQEAMNLRQIMSDLRPPVLEQRGLVPAVRELAARVSRELGAPVGVHGGHDVDLPPDVETLAYRVVQEALSNVVKHARASSVEVHIESSTGSLRVEVVDDGLGFDPADARTFLEEGKVGLASMRERSELAGGTFTIRSVRRKGTTVMALLPFDVLAAVDLPGAQG